MSQQSMANEITGQVPIDYLLALTLVNRSWRDIQNRRIWSFLWGKVAIPTFVGLANPGTVTLTPGTNTVIGDAAARAAWAGVGLVTPITTLQFRVGQGNLYSIIKYQDNVPPGFATLTLDQLFVDPASGAGQAYAILQSYFNAPVQDFLWWDSFYDPVTGYSLKTERTRQEINMLDPQRLQLAIPDSVVPYQINRQPGNFFQFPQYEMWPPGNGLTFVGEFLRGGADFQGVTDGVIYPIGEDVVIELSKVKAYEWCEANKHKLQPEQRNGDFRFLMGKAQKEYDKLIDQYELKDENFSHRNIIAFAERMGDLEIPWVSQKQMLANFPD